MAKPDPALLDAARYPFSCTIEPRFGDLDINMHLNNVAMAGIVEDGRVRFHRRVGYGDVLGNLSSMVASLQIDYLGEGRYPDAVTIYGAVEALGRTSHRIVNLLAQGERPIAFARSTIVTVGPEGPTPLPEGFRQGLDRWMLGA